MIKKNLFKVLLSLVICLTMIQPAAAISAEGEIQTNEGYKVGETFEITVVYTGTEFSRVNGQLEYDTDYIKYLSGGSSTGNSGIVQINDYADENGQIKFNLKFEGKKAGDTQLRLDTYEIYSINEEYLEVESVEKTITVEKAEEKETMEEVDSVDSVEEEVDHEEEIETEVVEDEIQQSDKIPFDTIMIFGAILGVLLLALVIATIKKR